MIFTERQITVRNGKSLINEPVILYRGDFEVSITFTIMESKFRFRSGVNLVDSEKASYGQLAILAPYGGNVFSDVVKCEDGTVTFTLTKEMIDQLEEVGLYSFQIRLFDYYRESRVSIPPVEFGIEVREPVASEDHDNKVNNAIVGYSIAKVVDPKEEGIGPTFDDRGNYNKTNWKTGDRISQVKLNKIEDALDKLNQNDDVLDKRITNNFNVLNSTKADTADVNSKIWRMDNMGQDVKEAMTGGSVAVVGKNTVLTDNIVNGQVTPIKTTFFDKSSINILNLTDGIFEGNGLTVSVNNGVITINGTSKYQSWLKLTNGCSFVTIASEYSSWMDERVYDIHSGDTYSCKSYIIGGTTNRNDINCTIVSARDSERTSLLNDTSNTTAVINSDVAFIQLFIETGVTFDNYAIAVLVVSGSTVPESYEEATKVKISENVMLPDYLNAELNDMHSDISNVKDSTNLNSNIRTGILNSLKKHDINIDYNIMKNKLYSKDSANFYKSGLTINIEDGLVTVNGTATDYIFIKLTNGYDIEGGAKNASKPGKWINESAMNYLSIGNSYHIPICVVGGTCVWKENESDATSSVIMSARNANYTSVLSGGAAKLVELKQEACYIQLYLPVGIVCTNLQLYCGLFENIKPAEFIIDTGVDVKIDLPQSKNSNATWRYQGNAVDYKEYPTTLSAVQKMEIPGVHFNAIQGGCTDGKYLYCGVVNNSNDEGDTTVHKIDIEKWTIVKTVTEYSLGHCNSMTYCDYDGYIHCIGLESYNDYKVVHRITTDLEYVDNYTIDISPHYAESTGIGAIDYNPNTEEFTFLIRGNSKGYARYTKNRTFIDIIWTENLGGSTYAGMSTDNNFIYQSVWYGGNNSSVGIIDKEGNILRNIQVTGMDGEIEETFIYKDKMLAVVNHGYTNHLVYEITPSDFILL